MEDAEALVEMHKEVYVAAMLGDVRFLEQDLSDEYLLRKTHKKNNIIHIAVRNQRLDFIEAILRRFQSNREQLICEENSQKDTPLHTAAEVGNLQIGGLIYGHLEKLTMIEGAEKPWRVKNLKGNTAAHHALIHGNLEIAMFLLHKDPGFARLLNHSDETLLHLAITHFVNDGKLSNLTLIYKVLWEHQMSREECEAVDKADIRFLRERLNVLGIEFLRSSDSKGQNILHKLFKVDFHKYPLPIDEIKPFILQGLNLDPGLLVSTDSNSDTPLHVAARHNLFLLHICHEFIESNHDPLDSTPWWCLKNADDNTPLHLALLHYNPGSLDDRFCLKRLFSYDFRAIGERNRNGETAFHLIKESNFASVLSDLVESYRKSLEYKESHEAIPSCVWAEDNNGITPLMKMVQEGRESSALRLIQYLGEDPVTFSPDYIERNTVLHMAIKNEQFDLICKIIELYDVPGQGRFLGSIFEHKNKKGETPADLLGDFDIVPPELEEKIWSHPLLRGIRSTWRIPNSQLQNYMSSMNVIAALLTTITFTAAFTVPGGLNQETGTPLLMASIAFQVFMIADVIAMCLSMMVLFCLLWIVATNKRNAVMIQDFAISLLLASFVATLLTFMMGVYATIYPVKPWIANTTLVLCSILMLLVRKYIFTNLLLPLKNAIAHPIHILTSKCTSAVIYCIDFLIYYTIQLGRMVLRL